MRYSQEYIDEIKEKIPQAAFRLFASKGIESVSMQNIADESGCGVASLYRYYGSKLNLVIDVGTQKYAYLAKQVEKRYQNMDGDRFTAYQEIEFYLECYIELFRRNKEMLRFNSNFDQYILHEHPTQEEMAPYYEAVSFFPKFFHSRYAKAFEDHSIRTDIPEEEVYYGIMYTMLTAASKFSYGTVFPGERKLDYTRALEMQKEAYLSYLTSRPEAENK